MSLDEEGKSLFEKQTEGREEVYFLKLQYGLTSKLLDVSEESQVVYGGPSANWTSWKGNDILVKVD